MSSSPETVVLPELRTGTWTRFGSDTVLGDVVTEGTLASLAASTRTAAQSQGYSVGWAEGMRAAREVALDEAAAAEEHRRAAEAVREAEHRAAVAALVSAAELLRTETAATCARVEDQASTLAWQLVSELVGREVATGIDVVQRVLALLPSEPLVSVRLHPADAAGAGELAEHLSVVADPSLQRGDALVDAVDHVLDLRLSTALDRVREALR